MAAVLTLDRTPPRPESCSFSCFAGPREVLSDDEDTGARDGEVSSSIEDIRRARGTSDPNSPSPPPPIGYHARFQEETPAFTTTRNCIYFSISLSGVSLLDEEPHMQRCSHI